uniref:Lysophospholipid acyltransferase family protein n=1 Tax=Roseihalotalea indica TaxID=2867963 RepID=A0AA49GM57_9BACT|nr:lysophospholipid acyltransferase family protein [Tunicatimonas sp. TK19036]
MANLQYYLFYYLLILPLSRLPFFLLYLISDFLFLVLYYLFPYRRKVVFTNLKNSFPEKTTQQLVEIERKFYRHLCDLIVESLKAFTISKEQARKRMKHINPEVLNRFFDEGKNVVMVGGHYCNWELFAVTIDQEIKHQSVALYTSFKNKFLNQKMLESRSRFGLKMLPFQDIKQRLSECNACPSVTIFGADQSPRKSQRAYWMEFLNQDTGVQYGTEKFARDYDMPVVQGNIYKVKRGYYEVVYTLLTEHPCQTEYGEITTMYTRFLEKVIQKQPEYWLWSHKRWKHKRPEVLAEKSPVEGC